MIHYLVNRMLNMVLVVFCVISLVFLLIHIVPGDPVETIIGETATLADKAELRAQLGLDRPLYQQWVQYMSRLARFDLGLSLYSGQAVSSMLLERIPATFYLGISSLIVAIIIALPLGISAALYQNSNWDRCTMVFSVLGVSIPNFFMGPILILIFSLSLGWLPVSGKDGFNSIILPSLTLGSALAAILSRMIRASILMILHEDYIRAAKARGLNNHYITVQHLLRNAALPVITTLGMQLGALLAGTVITETTFSWPGIGHLTVVAIQRRDYPVLQACILLISLSYVIINLFTDLLYMILDPRIRLE